MVLLYKVKQTKMKMKIVPKIEKDTLIVMTLFLVLIGFVVAGIQLGTKGITQGLVIGLFIILMSCVLFMEMFLKNGKFSFTLPNTIHLFIAGFGLAAGINAIIAISLPAVLVSASGVIVFLLALDTMIAMFT
jgi:hypothetical protein